MIGWLTLAAALAGVPEVVVSTWVSVKPGPEIMHPEGTSWSWLATSADEPWRLRCPAGVTPRRIALQGDDDGVVWLDAHETPRVDGHDLYFDPRPGGHWAVQGAGCRWQRLHRHTMGPRLDLLEYGAADVSELRSRVELSHAHAEDPVALHLLQSSESGRWWPTWLALRPRGGFASPLPDPRPDRGRRTPLDGRRGWQVAALEPWTVRGPATVEVVARVLDPVPEGPVCLRLDGAGPSCQPADALLELTVPVPVALGPRTHDDGRILSRRLRWQVWVGEGEHTLALDHDALARVQAADMRDLQAVRELPTQATLLAMAPQPDPAPRGPLEAAIGALARSTALLGPSKRPAEQPDDVSWLRPSDLGTTVAHVDPEGHASLLVPPSQGSLCTLHWGDRRWTTAASGFVSHFAVPGDAAPPRASGCEPRVRVVGPAPGITDRSVLVSGWRVPAETDLALRLPTVSDLELVQPSLLVHLPSWTDTVRLTLSHAAHTESYTLHASPGGGWIDLEGESWRGAVSIPLSSAELAVHASAPIVLRFSGRQAALDPTRGPTPLMPSLQAQEATAALAETEDPWRRAPLLAARAQALLEAGRADLAWRDLDAASRLDPELADGPAARASRTRLLRTLWPEGPIPLDARWVPDDAPAEVASEGRFMDLARTLEEDTDRVRYWLEAARTQVPDGRAGIAAWLDVVQAGLDPEDPGLSPVRAWSVWQRLAGVQGAMAELVTWPATPSDPYDELLFVESWPDDATRLRLGEDWVVRLGALVSPRTVELRCRPRDPALTRPCLLSRTGLRGESTAQWSVPADGRAHPVEVAAHDEVSFLGTGSARDHHVELRVPPVMAGGVEMLRQAAVLRTGTARVELLGPTVLRVEALGTTGTLTLWDDADRPVQVELTGPTTTAWLAIEETGARTVTLTAPTGTRLRVHARAPGGHPLEPVAHVRLLADTSATSLPGLPRADALQRPPPIPADRLGTSLTDLPPHNGPPITFAVQLAGGYGGDLEVDPMAATRIPARGRQSLSLTSRPTRLPWWWSGGVTMHESTGRSSLAELTAGTELRLTHRPWTGWLFGDLWGRLPVAPGLPLTMRGRVEGGGAWRATRALDLRAAVQGGFDRRLGAGSTSALARIPERLWNRRREQHPSWWTAELQPRLRASRWLRVDLTGRVIGNSLGDPALIDTALGEVGLVATAPSLRTGLSVGWWHRLPDLHREIATGSLHVRGTARTTHWIDRHTALQMRAGLAWWPQWERFGLEGSLTLLWSGREGLRDTRPSMTDARGVEAWAQARQD